MLGPEAVRAAPIAGALGEERRDAQLREVPDDGLAYVPHAVAGVPDPLEPVAILGAAIRVGLVERDRSQDVDPAAEVACRNED